MAAPEEYQENSTDASSSQDELNNDLTEELASAIKENNIDIVRSLLNNDVDLETPVKSNEACTFLLLAVAYDRPEIVRLLLDRGANAFARTKDFQKTALMYAVQHKISIKIVQLLLEKGGVQLLEQTDSDGETALHYAAKYGPTHLVEYLLKQENGSSQLLEQKNSLGFTVLHHAAAHARTDVLECFLKHRNRNSQLLEQKNIGGYTALLNAVDSGSTNTVECLLKYGASINARTYYGWTVLHLAAARDHQSLVLMFLQRLNAEFYRKVPKRESPIVAKDNSGLSPLIYAARCGPISSVLEFLEASVLFPDLGYQEEVEPYISDRKEAAEITELLLKAMNDRESGTTKSDWPDEFNGHIDAILYWAILNAQKPLFNKCMSKVRLLNPRTRKGTSWVTAAILGAKKPIIEKLLEHESLQKEWNERGPIDLLHSAIERRNIDFVKAFLARLRREKDAQEILSIFLCGFGNDKQNLITRSALGSTRTHRDIERFLWEELDKSIEDKPRFFVNPAERNGESDQERILELAARFGTPGKEEYLKTYLGHMLKEDSLPYYEEWNSLQLAVYLKLPMVVWWLLSNGGYLSENDIKNAEKVTRLWKAGNQVIKDLLEEPPPILRTGIPVDTYDQPCFQNSEEAEFSSAEGTVLDFIRVDWEAIFQIKRRQVVDIIYRKGPQEIMRECKYRKISNVRQAVHNSGPPAGGIEVASNPATVRWIHIPVNDERCMEDLLVRISREKGFTNKEYRPLADFMQKSRARIDAGGRKFYMKPQYVLQDTMDQDGTKKDRSQVSAFYMPYLFWSEQPEKFNIGEKKKFVHDSMTLDQYYYSSVDDTTERDKDQVVWRFTDGKPHSVVINDSSDSGEGLDEYSKAEDVTLGGKPFSTQPHGSRLPTILVVHQLWIWVLDQKTIISSITKEDYGEKDSFFQRVLARIKDQKMTSHWSVEDVRELILSTAIGMFDRAEIWGKSPLGIFREAIQNVRNKETGLFDAFCEKLQEDQNDEKRSLEDSSRNIIARLQNLWKILCRAIPYAAIQSEKEASLNEVDPSIHQSKNGALPTPMTTYDDILEETKLLREIKDICDELNMLKSLAEDQKEVCDKLWGKEYNAKAMFTYDTPSEITARIEEMIKEAEFVQKSIDMLLDLKQKQANINEAKNSRKQSEESAKQGLAIMVFTLVTIAFLPASFLTSLFALNVSDFPHDGETVRYEARWIFPIIFGVSVGASLIIAIIAFKMTKWRDWWERRKSKIEKEIEQDVEKGRKRRDRDGANAKYKLGGQRKVKNL